MREQIRLASSVLLLTALLTGCQREPEPRPVPPSVTPPSPVTPVIRTLPPPHPASVARFAGQYEASLPCANCQAIQTRLMLMPDGQAIRQQYFQSTRKEKEKQLIERVFWTGDDLAEQITLRIGSQTFFLDQPQWGSIRMLDMQGLPITGKTRERYVFQESPPRPLPAAQLITVPKIGYQPGNGQTIWVTATAASPDLSVTAPATQANINASSG